MQSDASARPSDALTATDTVAQTQDQAGAVFSSDRQLGFPLYAVSRKVVSLYQPFLKPLGLTYTQYIVLLALWEKNPILMKDLGTCLYLDHGTLTPVLKKLAEAGLLQRQRLRQDERMVSIKLTPKGQALREAVKDLPAQIRNSIKLEQEAAASLYHLLYQILNS
ncbi:MAG: MarR family transcriptional regulator [Oscillospiraceae bacterium]|nr:MarR family transcriptional regulator [Oscillospiraceae bacterium]MDD4368722.1 MarR family transcriptional regulator [Oscillospiraceae bacterium]